MNKSYRKASGEGNRRVVVCLTTDEAKTLDQSGNIALKIRLIAEARQAFGRRAAADLWFVLALPVVESMRHRPLQGDLFF